MKALRHPVTVSVAAVTAAYTVHLATADAHYKPGAHNTTHAIRGAWCGSQYRWCAGASEALRVARCESGLSRTATNGQFKGVFQMGSWERSRFGHGPDPWTQARAAHRYWRIAGWLPWQCAPWGGLRW